MSYRVSTPSLASRSKEIQTLLRGESDIEALEISRLPCERIILHSTNALPETIRCGDKSFSDTVLCHECHSILKNIEAKDEYESDKFIIQNRSLWRKIKDYASSHPKTTVALGLGLGLATLVVGGTAYAAYHYGTTTENAAIEITTAVWSTTTPVEKEIIPIRVDI